MGKVQTHYVSGRQGAALQKHLKADIQGLMFRGQLLPVHLRRWPLKLLRREQGHRRERQAVLLMAPLRTSPQ